MANINAGISRLQSTLYALHSTLYYILHLLIYSLTFTYLSHHLLSY